MVRYHHIMNKLVIMEKNYNNILTALRYYIPLRYWKLNNWDKIIKREEEIEKNIFQYKCSFFTLYFDNELKPITYGKQHVINNRVYYDTNDSNTDGAGTYTLLGCLFWEEQKGWGL